MILCFEAAPKKLLRSSTWCSSKRASRSCLCMLSFCMLPEAAFMLIGASIVLIGAAFCRSQQPLRRSKQLLCQSKQWITSNIVVIALGLSIIHQPLMHSTSLHVVNARGVGGLHDVDGCRPCWGGPNKNQISDITPLKNQILDIKVPPFNPPPPPCELFISNTESMIIRYTNCL